MVVLALAAHILRANLAEAGWDQIPTPKPTTLARARRNAAMHCCRQAVTAIGTATLSQLNRIQRGDELGDNDKNDLLAKLHDMRVKAFETREHKLDPAKPHLPALDSNERERIVEQFFEVKKKLNRL